VFLYFATPGEYIHDHGHVTDIGYINNWDEMENLWHHTFYNELRVAPEENPQIITESPLTSKAIQERTIQIMFETFNVPAMYLGDTALFSLYATGRTSGLVVNSGDGCTHAVPIINGRVMTESVKSMPIAGTLSSPPSLIIYMI
jgi:actin-related protein